MSINYNDLTPDELKAEIQRVTAVQIEEFKRTTPQWLIDSWDRQIDEGARRAQWLRETGKYM